MPKKIVCKCHEPIGISKTYRQPWSDVYLSWTDKPGRKRYHSAPTLISKVALESDIAINRSIIEKYPEEKFFRNENSVLRGIHSMLSIHDHILEDGEKTVPTIYTSKDYIDREEAEKMISELMKFKGYDNIICKWARVKFYVIPM